ncbi:coiled-coil domain-containing protein, putative [Pediculus humanus corporis]|uniref:Coiled-coil domain-containing protein, putative n=1 Tax=Pediculus humanus subsp. corporis TaxID=121224 RepID=E0VAL9_PEDHC|nr:coiled-coil domain-containing protein, putative [Pediculus humanus corporis]EEB10425.1 coiled-coil domain-containing protein, putative [Pediculus humanus corporis]
MADDENIGTLEEECLKRKERLKALKRKHNISDTSEESTTNKSIDLPKSYRPQDDKLKEQIIEDSKPGDVLVEVKDQLEAAKAKVVIEELDISNLAPQKPDWDLKRDISKKLEKLERRTHKAIAELIRERLKNEVKTLDLATSVALGAEAAQTES